MVSIVQLQKLSCSHMFSINLRRDDTKGRNDRRGFSSSETVALAPRFLSWRFTKAVQPARIFNAFYM